MNKFIKKAKDFGAKRHEGQFRRFNKAAYFTHPMAVGDLVQEFTNDLDVIVAAYLHDTIEDTSTTYEELIEEFSLKVADLVQELSSDEEKIAQIGKAQYLLDKMMQMTPEALLIKLADRYNNTSGFAADRKLLQSRGDEYNLNKLNKFIAKYIKETAFILNRLDRPLTPDHKKVIEMIRQNLVL